MKDDEPTANLTPSANQFAPTVSADSDEGDFAHSFSGEENFTNAPRDAALPNYAVARTIGLGGMGEVVLARDMRIGRHVAIKRLRSPNPSATAVARFTREARIQALLDHPSIVPVHEIGTDSAGHPYFTMKRLTGVTLSKVLKSKERPSVQHLLRVFVDACRAVSFAHERRIIHRDLKPANIMLGEYDEVYVIDWGVARVLDEDDAPSGAEEIDTIEGMTEAGTVLGTPGYMAPEQIQATDVGAPADVYALGATLFEILTGVPLHPRGAQALLTTAAGIDGSPRTRRPDRAIPPELDAITVAALSSDPEARPTARQLADAVQRYLDGDRDIERRRTLAARELEAAREALASGDLGRRASAVQAAGRALALDPESREAAALITSLMLEPPREPPPALRAELVAAEAAIQQRQARVAIRSLIAVQVFLIAAALNGLRDPAVLLGTAGWGVVMLVIAFVVSRRRALSWEFWVIAIGNLFLGALLSRLFGPLIITPVVSCIMAVSLTSYPRLIDRARLLLLAVAVAWAAPVALELAGMLEPTWQVVEGYVISTSHVVRIHGTATMTLLIGGNVLAIIVIGMLSNALARSRREALRTVQVQAWHLRQLLPAS